MCNKEKKKKMTYNVNTRQHESDLGYEDMNTHEQTDSPGQTTVK